MTKTAKSKSRKRKTYGRLRDHRTVTGVHMPANDDLLDDLFLGCAFAAFMQLAVASRDWPEPEPTRRLAYEMYEEALAERNAIRTIRISGPLRRFIASGD